MPVKFKYIKPKLRSKVQFNLKTAKRMVDSKYYVAQASLRKNYMAIQQKKIALATPSWNVITNLLDSYKRGAMDAINNNNYSSAAKVLYGIYKKNKDAAKKKTKIKTTHLIGVISRPEILMLAYRSIKGNKGAMTEGAIVTKEMFEKFSPAQRELYLKGLKLPDGMSLYLFHAMSQLIRKGNYPWGASRRIYIDKPGQPGKLRPLTIPPFMDRVVQKSIDMVLNAVYEPYFEARNRSFGFRPNRDSKAAMTALLSKFTNGMRTAVEGDIQAAYDNVDRDKLIKILGKKIGDTKFLNFLKGRLDYVVLDSGKYTKPNLGIPQGGIDSPYLFNIYMMELDDYIHDLADTEATRLNEGLPVDPIGPKYSSLRARAKKYKRKLSTVKKEMSRLPAIRTCPKVVAARARAFKVIKDIRLNKHQLNRVTSAHPDKRQLRFFYVRYADDWILLTNGSKQIGEMLKEKISQWLEENLGLKLSPEKTLVTDITRQPAKFLGFELRVSGRGALYRKEYKPKLTLKKTFKKYNVQKKSGLLLWAQPDKQRLISRFHMKGFCTPVGFPLTLPWLSCLEASAIIERFNATIRGLAEYYLPVIRNRAKIHRWVYILRYACFKTLAQKYKTTIRGIFKKFGHNQKNRSLQTIRIKVNLKAGEKEYSKDWTLLTYTQLLKLVKIEKKKLELEKEFWRIENGDMGGYAIKTGSMPKVTNDNFLETMTWVSFRTNCSLNMPCANCGTFERVHQHHLKQIRKNQFSVLKKKPSYVQLMALRNRKQIPLCEKCHLRLVHQGKYNGPPLKDMVPLTKLVDNRIVHIESFVKPGIVYNAKTLEQKGWVENKQWDPSQTNKLLDRKKKKGQKET